MSFVLETEEGGLSADLAPYREAFNALRPGVVGTLVVPTGDLDSKNKGKIAKEHERRFRDVARERNVGLGVRHTNLPDGTTRLRMAIGDKREFSQEQVAERTKKAAETRAKKAIAKFMSEGLTQKEATDKYKQILRDRIAAKKEKLAKVS